MEESDKPRGGPGSRGTLKLKTPAARTAQSPAPVARSRSAAKLATPNAAETTPAAPPPASLPAAAKPPSRHQESAHWADEHKHRMQADMDALSVGFAPPSNRRRR